MKVGFLTSCLPRVALTDLVAWAGQNGFQTLELAVWPVQNTRDYAGSTLDVANLDAEKAVATLDLFSRNHVAISCLTYCDNNLHRDPARRAAYLDHLRKVIDAARTLHVDVVSTFVGRDETKTIAENIAEATGVIGDVVRYAADRGIKIAIENCPMPNWQMEGLAGNIFYAPDIWDILFEAIPLDNFGLNFDPSHLFYLGIDPARTARDYGARIFHAHAKDTEIYPDKLQRIGNLGGTAPRLRNNQRANWWNYRMPGLGQIRWPELVAALRQGGYDSVLSTEHEDPVYEGSEEKVKEGLVLGRQFLSRLVA